MYNSKLVMKDESTCLDKHLEVFFNSNNMYIPFSWIISALLTNITASLLVVKEVYLLG